MKRVLMIAFHFPPIKVSSGIQRTLRFAQYLPQFGWEPLVLAPHPRVYDSTSQEDMGEPLRSMVVRRAFALDSAKHLTVRGRYPRIAAVPDRWVAWWPGAVVSGLRMIHQYRPDVIWSTYPIATAHLIGMSLHRLSGIPWIADLRDPMAQVGYPPDPMVRRSFLWIERQIARHARRVTFTTPGALADYTRRYPDAAARFSLLENGYDETAFRSAETVDAAEACGAAAGQAEARRPSAPLTLLHSGIIYPEERDPRPLFEAIARLAAEGSITPGRVRIVLRASGHDAYLKALIDASAIGDIVVLAPPLPYEAALQEMLSVDALLLLQAANCNDQIPAKMYEYFRARKPLLALTDPRGDTGRAIASAGIDTVASLESANEIVQVLPRFLALLESGSAPIASEAVVRAASREARTAAFAGLLDSV
jgi:glycosyltransferase involved in cell wall biosynthesis